MREIRRRSPVFTCKALHATFTATVKPLASVTGSTGAAWVFVYDPSGSGELTQANYPDGGHIRWVYGTATYSGNRKIREVTSRYVGNTGTAAEWGPYTFTHDDSGNTNPTIMPTRR
jgi:hypothetical protein